MTFLYNLLGLLAFRTQALRLQAEYRMIPGAIAIFSSGFLAYALVRNHVYGSLAEPTAPLIGPVHAFMVLNLIATIVFVSLVFLPGLLLLSNSIPGELPGFTFSSLEYRLHFSALLPVWGLLYLIAAPVQLFVPHFLSIGILDMSVGVFVRSILMAVYTVWVVKRLNFLTTIQSLSIFILCSFTLPVLFIPTYTWYAMLIVLLSGVICLFPRRLRRQLAKRADKRRVPQHLAVLASNAQDADANYQLGLFSLNNNDLYSAGKYFDTACRTAPDNPDYCYYLGRSYERKDQWPKALELYEETNRIHPEYGSGDIYRELGKAYLHTNNIEKAIECFKVFLNKRNMDPEARYWLAVALQRTGDTTQMIGELNRILYRAKADRSLFGGKNRHWVLASRDMLREARNNSQEILE